MCTLYVLNVSIGLQNATHTTKTRACAHVRVDHTHTHTTHTHTHTHTTETLVRAHVRVNDAFSHEECDEERVEE